MAGGVTPLMRKRKRTPSSSRQLFVSPKRGRTNPMKRPRFANLIRQQVILGRGPIPASSIVTLRYTGSHVSNGTAFDQVYNLNSIFDPDQSGGGHQPLGRDQFATLYNRYRVLKARVKIMFANADASTQPHLGGVVADNSTSAYTDFDLAAEQQGGYTTLFTEAAPVTIIRKYDLAKITGVTKTAYKDDRFQALMSASPAEAICIHVVFAKVFGGVAASGAVEFRVQIDYTTELFDPLPLASS